MKRLATSFGTLIALMIAPAAQAGSYSFSVGGHRFHVEAPRNCRSTSCVSVSERGGRPTDDANATPAPLPAPVQIVAPPQPVYPAAPVRPPQAIVVVAPPAPAPPAPVVAATTSQPVVLPPAPRLDPPCVAAPVVAPKPVTISQRSDDETTPLGQWESTGARGVVIIESCGTALCGYALTEASSKGESVLVNMKPKSHDVWAGNIYSRSSGNTYYATMTLKATGKLHVEACALGHFWCSGNDWARVEERQEKLITTSRQLGGARS